MDNEEILKEKHKEKLMEYINRTSFWTEKSINQLGYSINLFTTIGIGLLGYLIKNREQFPRFICGGDFNLLLTFYFSSAFLIFISIFFGFISVLSRLGDFRISRHLSLTRKRFLSRKNELINSKIIDISKEKCFKSFKKNVFGKIEFINEDDFGNNRLVEKFDQLRKESAILGDITWKMHKCQIVTFIIGSFLYLLTILR